MTKKKLKVPNDSQTNFISGSISLERHRHINFKYKCVGTFFSYQEVQIKKVTLIKKKVMKPQVGLLSILMLVDAWRYT